MPKSTRIPLLFPIIASFLHISDIPFQIVYMGRANGNPPREGASAGQEKPLDFSAQFKASFRTLWLVAVGITGDHGGALQAVTRDFRSSTIGSTVSTESSGANR